MVGLVYFAPKAHLSSVSSSHVHSFKPLFHSSQSGCHHISSSFKLSRNASCLSLTLLDKYGCMMDSKVFILKAFNSPVKRLHCDSSSCAIIGNGAVVTSIQHALGPVWRTFSVARHTGLQCGKRVKSGCTDTVAVPTRNSLTASATIGTNPFVLRVCSDQAVWKSNAAVICDKFMVKSYFSFSRARSRNQRTAMGVGFRDRSWNAAWDIRPAWWLQAHHLAWVLFGLCACFSTAAGLILPSMILSNPAQMEAAEQPSTILGGSASNEMLVTATHEKQVYTKYSVTRIPGDGRCLFRAIVHGACLRSGKPAPDQVLQQDLADELRSKVVDELINRRDETEWFIEGDFDRYVKRMRGPHVWGGEPELLMASHVLKIPITVYMYAEGSKGLISIAEYGQEYGKYPVRVLYNGSSHYDALEFLVNGIQSKL